MVALEDERVDFGEGGSLPSGECVPDQRCVELRAVLNKESSHALVTANKRLVKNAQSPAVFVRRRARAQETRRSLDVPALDRFKQLVGHGFNRVRDSCFRLDTAAAFCL